MFKIIFVKFLAIFLNALTYLFIAKIVGASQFGTFEVWRSWLNIFIIGLTFGYDTYIIKKVEQNKDQLLEIRRSHLFLLIGLTPFIILFPTIYFDSPILVLSFIISASLGAYLKLSQSFARIDAQHLYALIGDGIARNFPLLLIIFSIYFLYGIENVEVLVLSFLVSYILNFVYFYRYNFLSLFQIGRGKVLEDISKHLKSSYPFLLISGVQIILSKVDLIMIDQFMEPKFAGAYSIIARVGTAISIPMLGFNYLYMPKIRKWFLNDEIFLSTVYKKFKIIIAISFFLIIPIILFGDQFLIFMGEGYEVGYTAMIVLSGFYVIDTCFGPVGMIANMAEMETVTFWAKFYSLITNIILNIVLITQLGIVGAAIATGFSIAISNVYILYKVKKKIRWRK